MRPVSGHQNGHQPGVKKGAAGSPGTLDFPIKSGTFASVRAQFRPTPTTGSIFQPARRPWNTNLEGPAGHPEGHPIGVPRTAPARLGPARTGPAVGFVGKILHAAFRTGAHGKTPCRLVLRGSSTALAASLRATLSPPGRPDGGSARQVPGRAIFGAGCGARCSRRRTATMRSACASRPSRRLGLPARGLPCASFGVNGTLVGHHGPGGCGVSRASPPTQVTPKLHGLQHEEPPARLR